MAEGSALLSQRAGLLHAGTGTEMVTDFIKGRAEARGTGEGPEAAHRIIALFHAAVVLFEAIVQILARAVKDVAAKRTADSAGIGGMLIRGDPFRLVSDGRDRLLEKRLCGR